MKPKTRATQRPRAPPRGPPPPADAPPTYGATDLDYNEYLRIPDLLRLQVPLSKPPHHDELLFIVIHQAYELWFKLILHEFAAAIAAMQRRDAARAQHALHRCVQVTRLLVQQIHLLETMTPVEFLQFRDNLKPASGFQSLQFREIEFLAGLKDEAYLAYFRNRPEMIDRLRKRVAEPDLRSAYYDLLRADGLAVPARAAEAEGRGDAAAREAVLEALRRVYERPAERPDLYRLSETLLDLDEAFSLWREHHVRVVERIIGFKRGTGGSSGAAYLRSTTPKRFFPALWDVRTRLGEPS